MIEKGKYVLTRFIGFKKTSWVIHQCWNVIKWKVAIERDFVFILTA